MTHRIRVEGSRLRFAAAHMATYGGDLEPLHGHNYRVTVELVGTLTPESWVLDFSEVKAWAAGVCAELDHKFLLQRESRHLVMEESNAHWTLTFGDRRYVMPVGDVVALPIDNTTAERIAEWFAGRIVDELRRAGADNVERLSVGIEEAPGQSGWLTAQLR